MTNSKKIIYKCKYCNGNLKADGDIFLCLSCGKKYRLKAQYRQNAESDVAISDKQGETIRNEKKKEPLPQVEKPKPNTQQPGISKYNRPSTVITVAISVISTLAVLMVVGLIIYHPVKEIISSQLSALKEQIISEMPSTASEENEPDYESQIEALDRQIKETEEQLSGQDESLEDIQKQLEDMKKLLEDLQSKKDKAKTDTQTASSETEEAKESNNTTVTAKGNIIKNGTFALATKEQQEAACRQVVQQVAASLGIYTPEVTFFEWPGNASVAWNTALPETNRPGQTGFSVINCNTSHLFSQEEASSWGLSLEQNIVRVLAHETRHTYQAIQANTDTEYGQKCLASFNGYASYTDGIEAYYENFIEQDANAYADSYIKKYF